MQQEDYPIWIRYSTKESSAVRSSVFSEPLPVDPGYVVLVLVDQMNVKSFVGIDGATYWPLKDFIEAYLALPCR